MPYVTMAEAINMYYRSSKEIGLSEDGAYLLKKSEFYDFTTYFNSLTISKWEKYTRVQNFFLELDVKGKFVLTLVGHYKDSKGDIKREHIFAYFYDLPERRKIVVEYPSDIRSSVVSFQIDAYKDTYVYGAEYTSRIEPQNRKYPRITLVTTTFKKESYVKKNIEIFRSEILSDREYGEYFTWKIIDNGRTLEPGMVKDSRIEIIPNKNVGGSGGFARGILEALKQVQRPTHILLMDDDVIFFPDSFRRMCTLLSVLRPEYRDYFISGAMLEINARNIQHEDVGYFSPLGAHGPAKPRYNLNLWDSVIRNEEFLPEDIHQYSGWWFCCIPTTVVREDNLPLPVFVRGDDVEYSIRNHAKFITMNGICIWHEGFGTKFSGSLELYQVHRNDLILQALRQKEISDIQVIQRIKWLFWEEIYKFNYKGAELLLDAVEDYLKGPEYIFSLDGEQCMKDKKAKDNVLLPIPPEIEGLIDEKKLYSAKPLPGLKKFIYDYSCNGHRLPKFFSRSKPGIIPYGWGYYQSRMYLTKVNYAVDMNNNMYVKYERSGEEYKRLCKRFKNVIKAFNEKNEKVAADYCERGVEIVGKKFWQDYLADERMNGKEFK